MHAEVPRLMKDWCRYVNSQQATVPVLHEVCHKATLKAGRADVRVIVSVVRCPAKDVLRDGEHRLAYGSHMAIASNGDGMT